jgi:hypothetical protein
MSLSDKELSIIITTDLFAGCKNIKSKSQIKTVLKIRLRIVNYYRFFDDKRDIKDNGRWFGSVAVLTSAIWVEGP